MAAMVLQLGEAFRQGRLDVLQGAFTPDVVLEVAGQSRLSGEYRGSGQVIALIARALNWVDPATLPIDGVSEREGVLLSFRIDLRHLGVKQGYARMFQVMQFTGDGRISHIRLWAEDQDVLDRYLDQSDVVWVHVRVACPAGPSRRRGARFVYWGYNYIAGVKWLRLGWVPPGGSGPRSPDASLKAGTNTSANSEFALAA